ncbi:MAG: hypothetical protein EP335_13575 [Alphaproteobacteria bacterium]|nr:MAG: hypothetical protein EP335_13575 [Alphaproteobacteria bacterium]
MSRNLIFGGIVVVIVVLMTGASLMTDKTKVMRTGGVSVSLDEGALVIRQMDTETIISSDDESFKCNANGGSVTITRTDGTQITITCD